MSKDREELKRRLYNARESLDTELKPWHDPTSESCKAEIAKTCIALRNNNGGFLIFGIRDDGSSDPHRYFQDVQATFDPETIQEIISRYSSERFEIAVHFVERDGFDRVMIEVPSGVRIPVMCRSDLPKLKIAGGPPIGSLLHKDVFYVRTLNANGRASTSPATPQDVPRLMELCVENREADIGAFMRRQLAGIDITSTTDSLYQILQAAKAPTADEAVDLFRKECGERFLSYTEQTPIPNIGFREIAGIITGEFEPPELTQEYLWRIGNTPDKSGWRPFACLTSFGKYAPTPRDEDGIQSFVYEDGIFQICEFSRIESSGRFYLIEGIEDDLQHNQQNSPTRQRLDFAFQTKRCSDTLVKILHFAKAFCGQNSDCNLTFVIRWTGLKGRRLIARDNSDPFYVSRGMATQDVFTVNLTIPVVTAVNALGLPIAKSVRRLFRLFTDDLDDNMIQKIAEERLSGL